MGIVFENVTYSYHSGGNESQIGLQSFNLRLDEGKFIAILGAPGSGKSTLLQHFNGIIRPQEGTIHIVDYEITAGAAQKGMGELRKRVGLVFQFPEQQLFEDTVEKDICFGPINFGMSAEEAKAAARRAMKDLGLEESLLTRSPFQLSGGQMRKVAIATVLAADPDVFVLDEPTATLDQASREELLTLLHRLCKERGKTVIIVTHRLEEVMPYAEEYVVMEQGEAIFQGTPDELIQRKDVLDEAGIVMPPSVQFMRKFSEKFQIPCPKGPYRIEEIASYVQQTINAKR